MVRLQNIRVSIWFLVILLLLTYWTEADCAQPFQTFNVYKDDHFHSNSILTLTWKGHWYTTISLARVLWGSITTVQCKCWLDCRGPRQDPACSLLPGTGLPQPGHTGPAPDMSAVFDTVYRESHIYGNLILEMVDSRLLLSICEDAITSECLNLSEQMFTKVLGLIALVFTL